jgi:hypothetical protein
VSHTWQMVVRIDPCLDILRRLIAGGDTNDIPLAERAIAEYWVGTPTRARKSGLLYMQQILHEHHDGLSRESREVADRVDAYIEQMLAGQMR